MPHVMIVDDNPALREALGELLRFEGYEVSEAINGRDALERLASGKVPRLVILDLLMPVMGGEAFLEVLQGTRFAALPIVILTGMGGCGDAMALRERYGHEVLDKTGCMDALMRLVLHHCGEGMALPSLADGLKFAA